MIFETIHNQVFIETKLTEIEIFPIMKMRILEGKIFCVENYSKIVASRSKEKCFKPEILMLGI